MIEPKKKGRPKSVNTEYVIYKSIKTGYSKWLKKKKLEKGSIVPEAANYKKSQKELVEIEQRDSWLSREL